MKLLKILIVLLLLAGCTQNNTNTNTAIKPDISVNDVIQIELNNDSATVNGVEVNKSDYTWHVDPSTTHEDVKNAPAEYYTGTKLEEDYYIDHDLQYYPLLDLNDFKLINYDGEKEYAYYYNDGENNDFIFATLPNLSETVRTSMMHSESEALSNQVLHITKGGEYVISGNFNGQVRFECSEKEKITITLDNANISCTVAPALVFENAYECGTEMSDDFNINDAGVKVILKNDNNLTGCNIYRMLKNVYKTDSESVQKKVRKIDSPFYSFVSMIIEGDGNLTVNSNFEGMGSEMHLSFNGGNITINSVDDGVNVNEDNVSVVSFLSGNITINHAEGSEGDGIDSNGYVIIDGGNLSVNGVHAPDNAVDSEDGITYKSGNVTVDGKPIELSIGTMREINGEGQGFNKGQRPDGERPDMMERPDMGKPEHMDENNEFHKRKEDFDPDGFKPKDFDSQKPDKPQQQ